MRRGPTIVLNAGVENPHPTSANRAFHGQLLLRERCAKEVGRVSADQGIGQHVTIEVLEVTTDPGGVWQGPFGLIDRTCDEVGFRHVQVAQHALSLPFRARPGSQPRLAVEAAVEGIGGGRTLPTDQGAGNGSPSVGTSVSLIALGLTQRTRFRGLPALSLVPLARPPPKGCWPTTAPVGLSLM